MQKFDIDRFNLKKLKLNEQKLILKKTEYNDIVIKDNYLQDENNNKIGTKGDMYTKKIIDYILQNGTLDNNPRPYYKDLYKDAIYDKNNNTLILSNKEIKLGKNDKVIQKEEGLEVWTKAHTISVNNNIECSYDLSKEETPLITLRPIAIKSSVAEILWIYQKESNDLVEFDELLEKNTWEQNHKINNWWEEWAIRDSKGNYILNDKNHPTIGSCYGETVRKRNILKTEVIEALKNNPDGRRNISSLWQQDDFKYQHGLKPCAFLTIWNIRHEWDGKDYLDMTLVQRSSDFLTAGCINQVQYTVLQKMVARELGIEAGIFTWKPINIQLYDRHIEKAIEMIDRIPINCKANIKLNEEIKEFEKFTPNDVYIEDYKKELIKKQNPPIKMQLGI